MIVLDTEGHSDDPSPSLFSNAVSDYWSGGLGGWGKIILK
jgi:hypothetical protein